MTSVQFLTSDGHFIGFTAKGHTNYASVGKDIVCAGVSTLVQTTVLGLEQLVGLKLRLKQEKGSGYFSCLILQETDQEKLCQANFILNLMYLGLQQIAGEYQKYVEISIKEVEKNEV
ncbi:MAG TPA: ribosomal-processing cysteine protease Prp [Firmicutes bacterium]|jgi:hypothetical protein|nr:ribosomal-processing cysteine protease Prp [Bacillota bacterium]HBT16148.1 ribosomal-processing cysteine protease Prp [Bacillota bacterium]